MFYRMRFDGWIGGMLRASKVFPSDAESVEWWPAGSTAIWVRSGNEKGLDPLNAACLALGTTVLAKVQENKLELAEAYLILDAAINLAAHRGTPETFQALRILHSDIEELDKANRPKTTSAQRAPAGLSPESRDDSLGNTNAGKLLEMARLFAGVVEPKFRTGYPALFSFSKASEWTFYVTIASVWRACVGIHQATPPEQRTPLELAVREDLVRWHSSAERAYEHLQAFAMEGIAGEPTPVQKAERLIRIPSFWVVWSITDNRRFRGEEQAITDLHELIESEFCAYWTLRL